MISGDILFISGNDLIAKIIRWAQKSPYSHVALAINSENIIEAVGLVKIKINKIHHTNYKIMRVDLTEEQRKDLVEYAMTFIGKRYDYLGVIKWLIRLLIKPHKYGVYRSVNRMYCSELVDRIYQHIGIDLVPNRAEGDVLPIELEKSPLLKVIHVYKS